MTSGPGRHSKSIGGLPPGLTLLVGGSADVANVVAHLAASGIPVTGTADVAVAVVLLPGTGGRIQRSTLTARQQQVAGLVAQGLANKSIAQRLGLSQPTVASHVRNSLAKLGLANRAQLAIWVIGRTEPQLHQNG